MPSMMTDARRVARPGTTEVLAYASINAVYRNGSVRAMFIAVDAAGRVQNIVIDEINGGV